MSPATVFLVLFYSLSTGGPSGIRYFPMADMDTCLKSVAETKLGVPHGGDAETTVSVFCTNSLAVTTDATR